MDCESSQLTHKSRTIFRSLLLSDTLIVLRHSCIRAIDLRVVFSPRCILILEEVSLCRADWVSPIRTGSMDTCPEDGLRIVSEICRTSIILISFSEVVILAWTSSTHLALLGTCHGIVKGQAKTKVV
jgi:hypothetical protein